MKELLILFICMLIIGCRPVPADYIIKPADDPCPEGQKMTYYYDDVLPIIKETGCQSVATDAGKICKQKTDCIYNCIFSIRDLEQLNCETCNTGANCPVTINCEGILGRCEATKDESNLIIIEQDKARCLCSSV